MKIHNAEEYHISVICNICLSICDEMGMYGMSNAKALKYFIATITTNERNRFIVGPKVQRHSDVP